jgi:hypothetical protein
MMFMFTPDKFRAKAAEYKDLAKGTPVPEAAREFRRLERSFTDLANNEDWLADNYDKTVHSGQNVGEDNDADAAGEGNGATLAEEEVILRSLGAAVIMQWNTLPTKLRRELFDTAGSVGDLLKTRELRGQIARFLHKHKDDVANSAVPPAVEGAVGPGLLTKIDVACIEELAGTIGQPRPSPDR